MVANRRDVVLAGLGFGLGFVVGPRTAVLGAELPQRFSTYGVVPGGGKVDQTSMLQGAADAAARSGTPLFLPPGVYSTSRLELKSGTALEGVPGKSILRYRDGSTLLSIAQANDVRLEGLVLDGRKPLDRGGSLLAATEADRLQISNCQFIGASEHGVALRQVSGRVRDCEIAEIRKSGLFSEDATDLEIKRNHVHDCADTGIVIWRGANSEGTVIANNLVDKAATGISVTNFNDGGGFAVVQGNLIRNLFFRKDVNSRGNGISIEANTVAKGNLVENAPGFGILIGSGRYLREVSITANLIRNTHIGIGVSADKSAGCVLITGNMITGTKAGAIRAMSGPAPTGSDLAGESGGAFRGAVHSNVVS